MFRFLQTIFPQISIPLTYFFSLHPTSRPLSDNPLTIPLLGIQIFNLSSTTSHLHSMYCLVTIRSLPHPLYPCLLLASRLCNICSRVHWICLLQYSLDQIIPFHPFVICHRHWSRQSPPSTVGHMPPLAARYLRSSGTALGAV